MTSAELTLLYEQYGYLVHRRCLQLLRSPAGADDALQETFVRVLRYHREQGEKSMLGWLYGIAANACFDLMQKRDRHELSDDVEKQAEGRLSHGSAADPDRRAVLGAVLRKLDARTREIGVRHHLDGLTQEEVAAHTGYSRKTVGKKLALRTRGAARPGRSGRLPIATSKRTVSARAAGPSAAQAGRRRRRAARAGSAGARRGCLAVLLLSSPQGISNRD